MNVLTKETKAKEENEFKILLNLLVNERRRMKSNKTNVPKLSASFSVEK